MEFNYHTQPITAHGGKLINCQVSKEKEQAYKLIAVEQPLQLSAWELSDLELIGNGAFSPLQGFMGEADYNSVISNMRLADGTVWSIPITLAVTTDIAECYTIGDIITLTDNENQLHGYLQLSEKYMYDKQREAEKVFLTVDKNHPGVARTLAKGEVYLAGPVFTIDNIRERQFADFYYTPQQSRRLFYDVGWKTIVGFQTRNPVHRAHEYIQKSAMEIVDGLLLNPLVGETKSDDISAEIRMRSYQVLLDNYYPADRVRLAIFPAAMRYAGPREAIFHAIVRKNYGCTHFIVGRDHAGVGDYYGTYDAQKIFTNFLPEELAIKPLFFEHSFFCKACGNMATSKTCPHSATEHLHLSGTKVRELLRNGETPPQEFTRPEVASVLIDGLKSS